MEASSAAVTTSLLPSSTSAPEMSVETAYRLEAALSGLGIFVGIFLTTLGWWLLWLRFYRGPSAGSEDVEMDYLEVERRSY